MFIGSPKGPLDSNHEFNGFSVHNLGDTLFIGSNTDCTERALASTPYGFGVYWLSPDGITFILRGSATGELNLSRTSDGTLIRTLGGNPYLGYLSSLAFSADSTLIAVGASDGTGKVIVWRLADVLILQNFIVRRTNGSTPIITAVTFSPDGLLLATGDDEAARVWRVLDGASVATIPGGVSQLDFTADGASLVVGGSDSALRLWSVPSGSPSPYAPGHTAAVTAVAYSPSGSLVASSSGDPTIKIRNATDGKVVATLTGHSGAVNSIAFSPTGSLLVSGGSDNKVIVWDMTSLSQVRTLSGHTNAVRGVAFSPDGSLVASGSDAPEQAVKLWTVSSGANTRTLIGSAAGVSSVAFSPDGQTIAAGSQAGVGRLWNVATGSIARSYLAASQGAMSIAFSPDGQKLAAGWTSKILIFDAAQGTLLQTVDAHAKDGTVVAYSPDGLRLLSGNPDGSVKTWNTATWILVNNQTQETFANGSGVTSVGYSRDNTRLLYGRGDATIVVALTGSTGVNPLYTVTTNPSGLSVTVDGSTLTAPQSFSNWAASSGHTIGVSSPQGNYAFSSWSNGGAQNHSLTAPGFSTVYTANFSACTYSISPIGQTFTAVGGSGTLNVTAPTGCSWTAVSGVAWIHVTGVAAGTGNGAVSYSVDANTTAGQRVNPTSTFVIGGKDFTITQAAAGLVSATKVGTTYSGFSVLDANGNFAWDGTTTDKLISWSTFQTSEKPIYGDWNGDGKTKVGVYNNGTWLLDYNGNGVWDGPTIDKAIYWSTGQSTDVPVMGDWNGDGRTKIGIYNNGTWILDYNGNGVWEGPGVDKTIYWSTGQAGEVPVVGDWNGDGKTKIGIYANGTWILEYNGNYVWDGTGVDKLIYFGGPGYMPMVGDWNGSGWAKIGAYNVNGTWALDYNGNFVWDGTAIDRLTFFGGPEWTPVVGDWSGSGTTKIGAYTGGQWALDYNGNFGWDVPPDKLFSFGAPGQTPIVGKW